MPNTLIILIIIFAPTAICPIEETEETVVIPKEPDLIATNEEPFPWDDIRIPKFIQPIRYDIELTPNLTSEWVKGKIYLLVKYSY